MVDSGKSQAVSGVLADFLPPVREWFQRVFAAPSPPQRQAWPIIRSGADTLLLAPTGSGKTLAAFLCAIDNLLRQAATGGLADGVHVLYVSPLKALGNGYPTQLGRAAGGYS